MKAIRIICNVALISSSYFLRAQDVEWVSIIGGTSAQLQADAGEHIAFDKDGNVLLSSTFDGSSCQLNNTLLIPVSQYAWNGLSLRIDGSNTYKGHDHIPNSQLWHQNVSADGSEYGCGVFYLSTQIGTITLTSAQNALSGFAYRKDPSGNVLWVRKFDGNAAYCETRASAVDQNGNFYVTGMFMGTLSFGSIIRTSAAFTGSGNPGRRNMDGYIVKYDASGNVVWVRVLRGPAEDRIESIKTDAAGNVYASGCFEGGPNAPFQTDFFGGPQRSTTGPGTTMDLFAAKISASGNVKWVKTGGGNYNDYAEAIDVDKDGNVYVGGDYGSSAWFDGQRIDSADMSLNFLLNKYDSLGNLLWIRTGVGPGYDVARCIKVSEDGRMIYVTGVVSDQAKFGTDTVSGYGGEDILFATYENDGTLVNVHAMGSQGNDRGHFVNTHPQTGEIYITGFCENGAQFGQQSTTGYGGSDIFLAKLVAPNYVGIKERTAKAKEFRVYPVPADRVLTIYAEQPGGLMELYDHNGKKVLVKELNENNEQVDISTIGKGIYHLRVMKESSTVYTTRIIKN